MCLKGAAGMQLVWVSVFLIHRICPLSRSSNHVINGGNLYWRSQLPSNGCLVPTFITNSQYKVATADQSLCKLRLEGICTQCIIVCLLA